MQKDKPSDSPAKPDSDRGTPRPPQPSWRLPRAVLRDLREHGPSFVARKSLGTLSRAVQFKRYRYNPRLLTRSPADVRIDRPVFILGVQGGGVTVLSRCLHRNPKAVYPSGNSEKWSGPDELHNSRHLYDMPESLVHRSYHFGTVNETVEHHPRYGYQRAWLYATDELLPIYRKEAADADPQTTAGFRRVLGKIVLAYAIDPDDCRFIDKSQLYTIQVPYVVRMLEGCEPRFVLVARNPYATCGRAVAKEYGPERGGYIGDDMPARIACAVEHWSNSYRLALDAARDVPMLRVRFEDFLADPEKVVREICAFAEMEFHPRQIPTPSQRFPPCFPDDDKWYPLRRDENEKYLGRLDPDLVAALNRRASDVIEALGYDVLPVP